jgi:hypothetical protein
MDIAEELREVTLTIEAIDERLAIVASEETHPYVQDFQTLVLLDARVEALIRGERALQGSENARVFQKLIKATMERLVTTRARVQAIDQLLAERVQATLH